MSFLKICLNYWSIIYLFNLLKRQNDNQSYILQMLFWPSEVWVKCLLWTLYSDPKPVVIYVCFCFCFFGGSGQCYDYTTQSNPQIQCNPYQTTNGIFHRTRTKKFTICMETQKTPNSQSNLEKEKGSWKNQASWL